MAALDQTLIITPRQNAIERYAQSALKVTGSLAFVAPLLTRLVLGEAFFLTGRGKLENFDRTVSFFSDLGVPFAPWCTVGGGRFAPPGPFVSNSVQGSATRSWFRISPYAVIGEH